jgi:hypothetical protein
MLSFGLCVLSIELMKNGAAVGVRKTKCGRTRALQRGSLGRSVLPDGHHLRAATKFYQMLHWAAQQRRPTIHIDPPPLHWPTAR